MNNFKNKAYSNSKLSNLVNVCKQIRLLTLAVFKLNWDESRKKFFHRFSQPDSRKFENHIICLTIPAGILTFFVRNGSISVFKYFQKYNKPWDFLIIIFSHRPFLQIKKNSYCTWETVFCSVLLMICYFSSFWLLYYIKIGKSLFCLTLSRKFVDFNTFSEKVPKPNICYS